LWCSHGYNIVKYFISDKNIEHNNTSWRQQIINENENKVFAFIQQKMEQDVEGLYSTGQTSFAEDIIMIVMEKLLECRDVVTHTRGMMNQPVITGFLGATVRAAIQFRRRKRNRRRRRKRTKRRRMAR
jgi:hypothetical protein